MFGRSYNKVDLNGTHRCYLQSTPPVTEQLSKFYVA